MLLDRLLDESHPTDDEIELAWWELDRRAFQKTTNAGALVRVLLPRGRDLRHGDVLSTADATVRVRVEVKLADVFVVQAAEANSLALLALELGNLHIPTEIIDDELRTIPDGPAQQAISQLGLAHERKVVRFQPRRCAGMPQVRVAENVRIVRS